MGRVITDPDPLLCAALADDLSAAGYSAERVREAWGSAADDAIARGLRLPALRALGSRADALSSIARLFGLGSPVPLEVVTAAFPKLTAAGLEALGLARIERDHAVPLAVPLVLIRPQSFVDDVGAGQWWIASDLDEAALGTALPEDHVLGVGGASLTLAGLQLPTPAGRVLDLGTGCGIQALRARRYAAEAVATDVSERALWFTRLNAHLNRIDGIRTVHGSLFAPVSGGSFDRIVSNPPFVITPRSAEVPTYEYRDGGAEGDQLVADVVTGAGALLAPGGVAQLLGNWEYRGDADGLDRVRAWVGASAVPLDAWVVEREVLEPLAYAELWIRDGGTRPGTPAFEKLVAAWLDDFERREVRAIGFGYVLLRRPVAGAPTLSRYERITTPIAGDGGLGAHCARAVAAHDRLAMLDDDALAASVVIVAPDVTEARHHLPGAADPMVIELHQGGGFARVLSVDPALAALVGASDGDLTVGSLIGAIAELLEVDAAELRADLLPRVRELAFTGFLTFEEAPRG